METTFYQNLKNDKDKLYLFNQGKKQHLIDSFDQNTLTKLRSIYYACYPGILYLYMNPTSFSNIGGKLLILSYVFKDENYDLVHGNIDSMKCIDFSKYNVEPLDYNSWYEVRRGNKTWIYDTFSMLMFEKELYYKLEKPEVFQKISKNVIESHPARCDDDFSKPTDIWLFIEELEQIEDSIKNSPFKDLLLSEIMKYKEKINYDDAFLKWEQEELKIHKKVYFK